MQDIQKYPTVTSLQIQQADPGLDKDKKSIYSHPLFPLLALLLDQCEQATCSPDSQSPDTFDADLQSFSQRQDGADQSYFTENKDLDSLIIKAIQVLRIHINELRKVNELCRDFCTRYINCLKTKIHQDSMFDDSEASSPSCSDRLSPNIAQGSNSAYNSPYSIPGASLVRNYLEMGNNHRPQHYGHSGTYGISVDCSEYTNGDNSSPPISALSLNEDINNNNGYITSSANSAAFGSLLDSAKQKRGILPKKATQIMKQWLFQHLVHPYPTEDEKRQMANQTNLTLLQVNNWFINARRRILQPMLETSGSPSKEKATNGHGKTDKSDSVSESEDTGSAFMYNSSCGNRKKKAATNRPSNNRFWPASLAAAVNILSPTPVTTTSGPSTSPIITTVTCEPSTEKQVAQAESTNDTRSRKRPKIDPSDLNPYQPPKLFASSSNRSYESFIGDLDTKSRSDATSTPRYTELDSPNNSNKTATSVDSVDPVRTQSPVLEPNSKPRDLIASYLSSVASGDSPTSLFPANTSSYMPSNPYSSTMINHSNPYLNHQAMFYNASLQRAVQQDPTTLLGMRHHHHTTTTTPPHHPFPIYESIYPNYDHVNMVSQLFSSPHGFPLSWDDQKSTNSVTDSVGYPYAHLEPFTNFKAFQSKANTN